MYVLLFLTVALYLFQVQDSAKYARVFSFDRHAVASGEVWRLVTWQFTQVGHGWFEFPPIVALLFTMLLLFMMGGAVEEEWGTRRFLTLFLISTFASAGIAAILGVTLLGSYFINFSLLFVYASMFPQRLFRMLAVVVGIMLISVVFAGGAANLAALAGAVASYIYYLLQRPFIPKVVADE
ncbi:MAG TPA: rhomboid family intramembrane serine protease, partial [Thermoanaerobaculia bacterium]|nr:rhomboid family intramembrane serine protease [Thermoanaerobaculia bacterium]